MTRLCLSVALLFSASIANTIHAQAVVPAGTNIQVRTIDAIDENAPIGTQIRGSLAEPIKVGRTGMVIPRGSLVQGTAAKRQKGGAAEGRERINRAPA